VKVRISVVPFSFSELYPRGKKQNKKQDANNNKAPHLNNNGLRSRLQGKTKQQQQQQQQKQKGKTRRNITIEKKSVDEQVS
jgi:hypothetical protein